LSNKLPHRGVGIFLLVCAAVLALVWLVLSIVPALLAGQAPLEVRYYTTFITGALDIALVAPALALAGILFWRRAPLGYLLAPTLLVFCVVIATSLAASGVAQLLMGVMTTGQAIGFTVPFVLMGVFALWFIVAVMRQRGPETPLEKSRWQSARA
jgi:hypothetical protein